MTYKIATQEELAEHLGVTPRYLAGIERGERNLTLDSVDPLAKDLGVNADDLLTPENACLRPWRRTHADSKLVSDLGVHVDTD